MPLVITRREGEWVRIGEDVWVQVSEVWGRKVSLLIAAPQNVRIDRQELIQERPPLPALGRRPGGTDER